MHSMLRAVGSSRNALVALCRKKTAAKELIMDRVSRTFGVMMLDKGLFQVLIKLTDCLYWKMSL